MFDPKKMMDMMKKATEMQQNMADQLKDVKVSGSAGGDMVRVEMNGGFEILSLKIEQNVVNKDEIPFLEDLVTAALNDALAKAKKAGASQMKSLTSKFGF